MLEHPWAQVAEIRDGRKRPRIDLAFQKKKSGPEGPLQICDEFHSSVTLSAANEPDGLPGLNEDPDYPTWVRMHGMGLISALPMMPGVSGSVVRAWPPIQIAWWCRRR